MQVQRQIDRLLAQRAAEWIETLKTGGERERAAFAFWLRQSKLHVEHYLEAVAIDRELQGLTAAQCPDVDALPVQVAPNVVSLGRGADTPEGVRQPWRRIRVWSVGVAAVASVAALAVMFSPIQRISTAAGEQRTLTLADGSVVTLNTQTKIRVEFSGQQRAVMLDSGEAVFKVAQEAARPFVVHAGTSAVRALGTQFNIYRRPEDTVVSVLEGRVQITTSAPTQSAQNLAAGEEAQVLPNGRIDKRMSVDTQRALAWRDRRLSFNETPLAEMVREFNRYSGSVRLRLEGPVDEKYRYGGVFDADDPESLAALLSKEPDLVIERREREILIRPR